MISILTRLLLALTLLGAVPATAHEMRPAVATLTSGDAALELNIDFNLEAALAGISEEHEDTADAPEAAEYDRLRGLSPDALAAELQAADLNFVQLDVDGQPVTFAFEGAEIPAVGNLDVARESIVTLTAPLPATASAQMTWIAAGGPAILVVDGPDGEPVHQEYLSSGATSASFDLTGVERQSQWSVFVNYAEQGYLHIIPKGLDHILFVIGLFLLAAHVRPLLMQVTAFTAAHTVTLALGTVGILNLPPTVVEPLIALSITYVCVENILTREMRWWRPIVIFMFGLLHGLGFAGVLGDVGLSGEHFFTSLIAFNIGVEIGQLAVIAACFLAVGLWFRNKSWYRAVVVIPASLIIGAIGLYWFVERIGLI
ncbi:HupE / UreJ protein [Monaibacterium marinum]|uniref:HupE / UreJ protein n=1 Tax=Pontivivens marinum TaxID=1690039 RepID=A0A2C9CQV9_9RHOB|nr:HupE/UreJ family protein [Monaibacterium marinum]SOH92759.1 HupE / UreJ protein [Monaibacterium marinum]